MDSIITKDFYQISLIQKLTYAGAGYPNGFEFALGAPPNGFCAPVDGCG